MRGIWDSIESVIGDLGITGQSATAVARAFASPTQSNIQAVQSAFQASGASAPPELIDTLYARYYDSLRSNPFYAAGASQSALMDLLPWVAGGAILYYAFFKNRKG